ncbi:chemotaxis protein CheW [Clostridium saccharobutylicum]|uniref:Putative CheW protein n=1 Tax=Clostridium saccharobutylicum DSM 13864 TaxID=1345695 RepID=U5MRZ7_CLOSA|nr:chemotaxis protein CheW [Clostridium saccharobutylicum]AGX43303.1 putative CheW protein [Clostridium saccharobutylicum DSM 13864]AQR90603.1 chemotaxis protein CheW [Clostridium saccharobutylicum]AQS00507.1 chemotaxis protein CheW [Clostridium saccharobutylicum]AQS10158.1 chemotaxis protein CheW [Clostridium saccharobutylicum]AQS14490.1 chemotaxis protein CheW [Clostridium saccharobutylicum]
MDELKDIQYIAFELSNEKYALKISDVYEIIRMQQISQTHNSKFFLEGVINLRGKVIPVVNLHKRFNLTEEMVTKETRIIVVKSREEMIGIIVDKVEQVIKLNDIQPTPNVVSGIDGEYFEGIGITKNGVISLLKMDTVLYD